MKYFFLIAVLWNSFIRADQVQNPLLKMKEEPSVETIKKWIDEGADVNEKTNEDLTPLIIAAKNKWYGTVQILVDHGAEVNAVDKDGNTALHHTAYNNDLKTGNIILSHQQLVHQGERLVERIIRTPVRRFESDYVKINAYNQDHQTAFMIAVQKGFLEYAEMLRSHHANIEAHDENGRTSLFYAVLNKDLKAVQYLDTHNVNMKVKDKNNSTPLHKAVQLREHAIVEVLVKDGKSPLNDSSQEYLPPLHEAVMALDERMIEVLIGAGAGVNNTHTGEQARLSPLALLFVLPDVSEDKMVQITQLFVNAGGNVNSLDHSVIERNTFLHIAVIRGYEKLIEVLLSSKAKLDTYNAEGRTPVSLAIEKNQPESVRLLIKAGAGSNQKPSDIFNFHYLNLAAQYGFAEIVDILLEANASVTFRDANGNTALNQAFEKPWLGNPRVKTNKEVSQVVEKLLNAKADVNTQDNDKLTPAMKAVMRNNASALEILMKFGADLMLKDHLGRTVYDHLEFIRQHEPGWDTSKIRKILLRRCEDSFSSPA